MPDFVANAEFGTVPVVSEAICAPWSSIAEACPPCEEADPTVLEDNILAASELLYVLSGRQFNGICETTVRPCRQDSNWCGCNRPTKCGCRRLSELDLGHYPLRSIVEVVRDGVVVDPSEYRIDDFRWLVSLGDPWECCQDLSLPSTEPDTLEVTFRFGRRPPLAGRLAARDLACQLTLACTGSGECDLPARTQQVTRQGVTVTMLAGEEFLSDLKLSVPTLGMFLEAYNPSDRRRDPVVWSPDVPQKVRRVAT